MFNFMPYTIRSLMALLLTSLVFSSPAMSHNFKLETLADNLGIVWGMDFISEDQMILTERDGQAWLLQPSSRKLTPLEGLPQVYAQSQGGLLDVKVSPHYAEDGWIYFTYAKAQNQSAVTTLARAKLQNQTLTQWQELLVTDSESNRSIHFGSRIAFDNHGHLFFGVGDRGVRENGQIFSNHAGSILRLKLNGEIPADNPFINDRKVLNEIWSLGHRNPQGLVYDPQRDILWEIEHGPRGGDELNIIKKGQNYGWPIVSQGKEYWGPVAVGVRHQPGMIDPVKVYIPSIAPSSLMLYQGQAFAHWSGSLFTGALVGRHLNIILLDSAGKVMGEQRLLEDLNERIRSLAQDHKGYIYLATDSGKVMQMRPTDSTGK